MNQRQPLDTPLQHLAMSKPWPIRHCGHSAEPVRQRHSNEFDLMTALTDASQLSNGWLVLIAPPTIPAVALFQQQGIDPKRVLIVHSRKIKNWQQTLERSVSSGHCAAVFTWLPDQIALDKAKLQQISHQAGVPTYFFGTVPMGEVATLTPHLSYGEQDIYLNH